MGKPRVQAPHHTQHSVGRWFLLTMGAVALLNSVPASSAWVNISPAGGEVILLINYTGTPAVSFSVPSASIGTTPATPILASNTGPGSAAIPLEIEMAVKRPPGPTDVTATMTATAPATLSGTIPISTISWTSAAIAGEPAGTTLIPSGSFVSGAQTMVSITTAGGATVSAGGALTFTYANSTVYPEGSYGPTTVNFTASRNP